MNRCAHFSHGFVAMLFAVSLCAASPPSQANADLPWSGKPFQLVASEKKLGDFLRELAASQGATAVINGKLDGAISGKFVVQGRSGALKILDSVCSSYGLVYFFDDSMLFIEQSSEIRSEVLPIHAAKASRIAQATRYLQSGPRPFSLRVNAANGTVTVSGPPRYLEAVRKIVKQADQQEAGVDRSEVRLFALKYSWANDLPMRRAGQSLVVPGVVSVLRSLFHGTPGALAHSSDANSNVKAMPRVTGDRQIDLPSGATTTAPKIELPSLASSDGSMDSAVRGGANQNLPQFHADSRLNAVLVRDLPERMAQYERLIPQMDVRPALVEIDVTIMDVQSDSVDSLGVDWSLSGRRGDLGVSGRTQVTPFSAQGAGSMLTLTLGNPLGNFLLNRVNALAAQGQARFVSRPKLLTLDNTEAQLNSREEFYVRVAGHQDSSLYTVNAGTQLRVTPKIIPETKGHSSVLMVLDIDDDSVNTDKLVDNLPRVTRRNLSTQTLLQEGHSVLLAGYSTETSVAATRSVPLLSKLPGVGGLFSHREKERHNMERFYLLTPRFVQPGEAMAGVAASEAVPSAHLVDQARDAAAPAPIPTYVAPQEPLSTGANLQQLPLNRERKSSAAPASSSKALGHSLKSRQKPEPRGESASGASTSNNAPVFWEDES